MSLRKLDVTDYLFILFLIFVLAGSWSFLNHIIEQSRLEQAVVTLPDIRVIGKVTESIPVNSYTVRLRLDDGDHADTGNHGRHSGRRDGSAVPDSQPEGLAVSESTEYG